MNYIHLIICFCDDLFTAVTILLHEDDSYILKKISVESKSLLCISMLKSTCAVLC